MATPLWVVVRMEPHHKRLPLGRGGGGGGGGVGELKLSSYFDTDY